MVVPNGTEALLHSSATYSGSITNSRVFVTNFALVYRCKHNFKGLSLHRMPPLTSSLPNHMVAQIVSLALVLICLVSVPLQEAHSQTLDDVFNKLEISDGLREAYAEFWHYKSKDRDKAYAVGGIVLELAEQEFEKDHPILAAVHIELASFKYSWRGYDFEEVEQHMLRALSIRSKNKGGLYYLDATLRITLAREYLSRERYEDAKVQLSLIYQHEDEVFDEVFQSAMARELTDLDQRRHEFESYPESYKSEQLGMVHLDSYRAALMSTAVFHRIKGDIEAAEQLENEASSLILPEKLPRPEPVNPYVSCLLPEQNTPVYHKRSRCESLMGTEVSD